MVNKAKVEEAIRLLLEGIGEDVNREGLKDKPARVARMYEEICAGMGQSPKEHLEKTFAADSNEMVIEKDITFHSSCEHHLMPFFGKVHIGLSKLARTVEVYARRLQIQELMTAQIADAIMEYLQPKGVIVMVEAEHMCMSMRGVKKPGSQTVTLATRGEFSEYEGIKNTFLNLVSR